MKQVGPHGQITEYDFVSLESNVVIMAPNQTMQRGFPNQDGWQNLADNDTSPGLNCVVAHPMNLANRPMTDKSGSNLQTKSNLQQIKTD